MGFLPVLDADTRLDVEFALAYGGQGGFKIDVAALTPRERLGFLKRLHDAKEAEAAAWDVELRKAGVK